MTVREIFDVHGEKLEACFPHLPPLHRRGLVLELLELKARAPLRVELPPRAPIQSLLIRGAELSSAVLELLEAKANAYGYGLRRLEGRGEVLYAMEELKTPFPAPRGLLGATESDDSNAGKVITPPETPAP